MARFDNVDLGTSKSLLRTMRMVIIRSNEHIEELAALLRETHPDAADMLLTSKEEVPTI